MRVDIANDSSPLVVDLDGTLLRSDLLLETGLLFLRDQPYRAWLLLGWLALGKSQLKESLALATRLDVVHLPYDERVLAMIRHAKAQGRRIVLATASHANLAEAVAGHLGLFDEVLATTTHDNLAGARKRDMLVDRFGRGGFDYAGNSQDDIVVWHAARTAHVVNAPAAVLRRARSHGNVGEVIEDTRRPWAHWQVALRLHQWLKNLLVFVPLLAAHRVTDPQAWASTLWAFLAFGLCASSVYILNDLLDLQDDRHHPRKRRRSFAAGDLPLSSGIAAAPLLLVTAFALSWWQLPPAFTAVLATYYASTLAYSLYLKRHMVVDVITLAGLYTVRIVAGVAAISTEVTFWLLAFSMFIFLSLALVKRYADLKGLEAQGHEGQIRGRGYRIDDQSIVGSLGAAAGFSAVLVLALYVQDPATAALYRHPWVLWLVCPLMLAWICRVWVLAHRGTMHDDPVVFAIKDRISLLTGLMFAVVVGAAS